MCFIALVELGAANSVCYIRDELLIVQGIKVFQLGGKVQRPQHPIILADDWNGDAGHKVIQLTDDNAISTLSCLANLLQQFIGVNDGIGGIGYQVVAVYPGLQRFIIQLGKEQLSGGGAVGGEYCAGQAVFIIAYNKLSRCGQVQDGFLIQHRRAHLAVFLPGGAALPGRV